MTWQLCGVSTSIYLPTYLPIYLSTYLPIYLSAYLPICTCVYTCIYIYIYICVVDMHMYVYTNYACIHIYIYIYIHTRMCVHKYIHIIHMHVHTFMRRASHPMRGERMLNDDQLIEEYDGRVRRGERMCGARSGGAERMERGSERGLWWAGHAYR